jgi:hypothetical protein
MDPVHRPARRHSLEPLPPPGGLRRGHPLGQLYDRLHPAGGATPLPASLSAAAPPHAHPLPDGDPDAHADPHRHPDAHPDGDAHGDTDTHREPDPDGDADPDRDAHGDPNGEPDANGDPDPVPGAIADTDSVPGATADGSADRPSVSSVAIK